jgi:hypothetical protein
MNVKIYSFGEISAKQTLLVALMLNFSFIYVEILEEINLFSLVLYLFLDRFQSTFIKEIMLIEGFFIDSIFELPFKALKVKLFEEGLHFFLKNDIRFCNIPHISQLKILYLKNLILVPYLLQSLLNLINNILFH